MDNRKVFIALIRFVLTGQREKDYTCDWEALYRISSAHKLSPMVYDAVTKLSLPVPDHVKNRFQEDYYKAMSREAIFQAEYERIESCFIKEQIPFIPLKGLLIKSYYPVEWMRVRSDSDILVQSKDTERIKALMEDMGYFVKCYGIGNNDAYYLEPVVNVEIHRSLFTERQGSWYDFFTEAEKRAWESWRNNGPCLFSKEINYLYFLTHAAKHMRGGGTGVRSILDAWLLWNAEAGSLDMEYIEKSLETLGLTVFHNRVRELGAYWFGDGEAGEELEVMAAMVLKNGVYGRSDNSQMAEIVRNTDSQSRGKRLYLEKLRVLWPSFFPPLESLKHAYPMLDKCPLLLPAVHVYRMGKFILFLDKRRPVISLMKKSDEEVRQYQDYLKIIGLERTIV